MARHRPRVRRLVGVTQFEMKIRCSPDYETECNLVQFLPGCQLCVILRRGGNDLGVAYDLALIVKKENPSPLPFNGRVFLPRWGAHLRNDESSKCSCKESEEEDVD